MSLPSPFFSVFTMTPSCSRPRCLLYILMTQLCNYLPIRLTNSNLFVLQGNQVNLIYSLSCKNLNSFWFPITKVQDHCLTCKPFSVSWTFNPCFNSYYSPTWSLSSSHICMLCSRAVNGSLPRCQEIKRWYLLRSWLKGSWDHIWVRDKGTKIN